MKGLILLNAYMSTESYMNQANRLKYEFELLGAQIDILRNDIFACIIEDGKIISKLSNYDFCIYLDKDKYISQMLNKLGVKLFNSHNSIYLCDDKMLTHIALSNHDVPMPKTLSGLLCYNKHEKIKAITIDAIEKELNYPVVIKTCHGSLGKGVFMADNRLQLEQIMEEVKLETHLFQEFVSTSKGRDVRVIVIGGKSFAWMQRVSNSDFRSNIEIGGNGYPLDLQKSFRELSEKIAKILNLDYCGIDLLFGKNDAPILCEVNSNAFFGKIEEITGKNVAKAYAEHIIHVCGKR